MRSAVAYLDKGVRVVGDPAFHDDKEMAKGNVFYYTKRVLARRIHDPDIQEFIKKHPFGPCVEPSSSNKDTATCVFHTKARGHKDAHALYPEQISAGILSTLKEAYVNHLNQAVSLTCPPVVVITVPANFTTAQRKATLNAARIAEIDNVTLCNEPTAAAFGHHLTMKTAMPISAYVLVFDLGGGTLDVTITHMGYDRDLWLSQVWKKVQKRMNILDNIDDRNRLMACFGALRQGNQTQQYRARRELNEAIDVRCVRVCGSKLSRFKTLNSLEHHTHTGTRSTFFRERHGM